MKNIYRRVYAFLSKDKPLPKFIYTIVMVLTHDVSKALVGIIASAIFAQYYITQEMGTIGGTVETSPNIKFILLFILVYALLGLSWLFWRKVFAVGIASSRAVEHSLKAIKGIISGRNKAMSRIIGGSSNDIVADAISFFCQPLGGNNGMCDKIKAVFDEQYPGADSKVLLFQRKFIPLKDGGDQYCLIDHDSECLDIDRIGWQPFNIQALKKDYQDPNKKKQAGPAVPAHALPFILDSSEPIVFLGEADIASNYMNCNIHNPTLTHIAISCHLEHATVFVIQITSHCETEKSKIALKRVVKELFSVFTVEILNEYCTKVLVDKIKHK